MVIDVEDANHNLITTTSNESRNDLIGAEIAKWREDMKSFIDKFSKRKRKRKRKSPSLNPIQDQRNKRKIANAKKANPHPVTEVVSDVVGAEDTIPADTTENLESNNMRLVFQEMQKKATAKLLDKGGLPQIPSSIWDDFQEHFENYTTPNYEVINKAKFLCWHKDIKNNKRKNEEFKAIDEYYCSCNNYAQRPHFYFCLQKANSKEPDPDVNISLKLIYIQDEVWKEFV